MLFCIFLFNSRLKPLGLGGVPQTKVKFESIVRGTNMLLVLVFPWDLLTIGKI